MGDGPLTIINRTAEAVYKSVGKIKHTFTVAKYSANAVNEIVGTIK
jgi:hypothetical protein